MASLKFKERSFASFAQRRTIPGVATQEFCLNVTLVVFAHQVSHFRTNGGGGIEDYIDDLSKEPVLVVWCGCYLTNGPLEAGMAGVNSRNLSDVLCKAIEDGVSVIEGAPLKLATR